MREYELYQEIGRNKDLEKVAIFRFSVEPQRGDTIAIGDGLWVVDRRHWSENGNTYFIVRERHGRLIPA